MPVNNNILTTIDYDQLKQSLVNYYAANAFFKDYDFSTSSLQSLIRLLTQNSYLNGFYVNMALCESFLDSCQLKSSAISRAKELNYTPASFRSSSANVTLSFNANSGAVTILKGQSFSSVVNNNLLVYTVPSTFVMASPNGFFTSNLTLYEGAFFNDTYIFNSQDETQRLVITNPTVDATSLSVVVYENGNTVGTSFIEATTLLDLTEVSKVFFLQQAENELYEVIFGDGVVGYKPADGSTIVLDYRICNGTDGNEATTYVPNFNPGNGVSSSINVQSFAASAGGANGETLNTIKFKAPRHFEVQERAVGERDYGVLLQEQFPEIDAVSAYGGETLTPPQYGTVVVAIDIAGVDGIPQSKRDAYYQFLKARCPLTINPMFISPARAYIKLSSTVTYNVNDTASSAAAMAATVQQAVLGFSANNLGSFSATCRYSRLSRTIDDADPAILGNQTTLQAYMKISPVRGAPAVPWVLNFDQPLFRNEQQDSDVVVHPHSLNTVESDTFNLGGILYSLEDDSEGSIHLVNNGRLIDVVGSVDYATGLVQLNSFRVDFYDGPYIRVYVRTAAQDIISDNATILLIESSSIYVTAVPVRQ